MTALTIEDVAGLLPGLIADGIAEAFKEQASKPVLSPNLTVQMKTGTVVTAGPTSALVQPDGADPGDYETWELGTTVAVGGRVTALAHAQGRRLIVGSNTAAGTSTGGGVTTGALIGSTSNATTAETAVDSLTGSLVSLRAKPGGAVASGGLLGQYAFGGTYDATHFNDNTAGLSAHANQLFSSTHAGSYLSLFTTPNDSVTPAEVMKVTAGGNVHLSNAGVLDSLGWLSGGQLKSSTSIVVNPSLATTGTLTHGGTDGVLVQDSKTITSAAAPFTSTDVGKWLIVNAGTITAGLPSATGATDGFSFCSGFIVSVAPGGGSCVIDQPSPVSATSCTFVVQDVTPGTALNVIWNNAYTDPGGGTFSPFVQSNYSQFGNQGPRGVFGIEGTYTIQNISGSRASFAPITMQTFLVRKNARGVATSMQGGAPGLNLSDQVIADGATLTLVGGLGSGAYRSFVNNTVFDTINGGILDASAVEFREYQTQSGIRNGVHLKTRIGFLINPFGTGIPGTETLSGTSTAVSATTLTDATASWTTNQFVGLRLWSQSTGHNALITSNTSTVLTFSGGWTGGTPAVGAYRIGGILDHNYGLFIRAQTTPNGFTAYTPIGIATQSRIEILPTGSWLASSANDLVMPFTSNPMGGGFIYTDAANTYTLNFANATMGSFINWGATIALKQSGSGFGVFSGFTANATITNDPTYNPSGNLGANLGPAFLFVASSNFQADTRDITSGASIDMYSSPSYLTINSGTLVSTSHSGYKSELAVGSGATVTTRYAIQISDATGGGSLGTQYGLYVAAFSKGGTANWGIYNLADTKFGSGTTVDFTGASIVGLSGITNALRIDSAATNAINVITATSGIFGVRYYAGAPQFQIGRVDGTTSAGTPVLSGEGLGNLVFTGSTTTAANPVVVGGAKVVAKATENWSATAAGSSLAFQTTPNTTIGGVTALLLDQDASATFTGLVTAAGYVNALDITTAPTNARNVITAASGLTGLRYYAGSPNFRLARADGNTTSGTPVQSGETIGIYSLGGATTTAADPTIYSAASMRAIATETYSSTAGGTQLVFSTTPNTTHTLTTAVTIDQDQSVAMVGAVSMGAAGLLVSATGAITTAITNLRASAPGTLQLQRDNGAATTATSGTLGQVLFYGASNTSGNMVLSAAILGAPEGTFTGSSGPGALSFQTTPSAAIATTARLRIDSTGTLHVAPTLTSGLVTAATLAIKADGSLWAGSLTYTSNQPTAANFAVSSTGVLTLGTPLAVGSGGTGLSSLATFLLTDGTTNVSTANVLLNRSAAQCNLTMSRDDGAASASGAVLMGITGRGTTAASTFGNAGQIRIVADALFTSGPSSPGRIELLTTPTGSTTQVVRAVIDNAGNFGVGASIAAATFEATAAGAYYGSMDTMTYASTISLDVTLGNVHKTTTVNATGAATINASAVGTAGQHMWVMIKNDATSGKVITFGTNFHSTGTITGTTSKVAMIHFISDGVGWYEVARTLALT